MHKRHSFLVVFPEKQEQLQNARFQGKLPLLVSFSNDEFDWPIELA